MKINSKLELSIASNSVTRVAACHTPCFYLQARHWQWCPSWCNRRWGNKRPYISPDNGRRTAQTSIIQLTTKYVGLLEAKHPACCQIGNNLHEPPPDELKQNVVDWWKRLNYFEQESLANAKVSARQPWHIGRSSLNRPHLGSPRRPAIST